jgi:hypothetical protein
MDEGRPVAPGPSMQGSWVAQQGLAGNGQAVSPLQRSDPTPKRGLTEGKAPCIDRPEAPQGPGLAGDEGLRGFEELVPIDEYVAHRGS